MIVSRPKTVMNHGSPAAISSPLPLARSRSAARSSIARSYERCSTATPVVSFGTVRRQALSEASTRRPSAGSATTAASASAAVSPGANWRSSSHSACGARET